MNEGSEFSPPSWLLGVPKVELHLHLEGSISADHAAVLSQETGVTIPGLVRDETAHGGWRYEVSNFSQFMGLYVGISACLVDHERVVEAIGFAAQRLAAQHIRYAEVTFTPLTHIARGWSGDALLDALAQGRKLAKKEWGVDINWVFDIVRVFPDQAAPTLELALRARDRDVGLVALGVGGPEGPSWPNLPLAETFNRAKDAGLPAVPHAGEQDGPASVLEALDLFHATRIGHGFRAVESADLLARLADEQICLEVCPGSNIALVGVPSYAAHPIEQLRAAGIPVSLASDDPPLVRTDLLREFAAGCHHYGWGIEQVASILRDGIMYSFAQPSQKEALLQELESHCAAVSVE